MVAVVVVIIVIVLLSRHVMHRLRWNMRIRSHIVVSI